jgi:hypothetical protein
MSDAPPPRPTSWSRAQLGFTPRPAVDWFSPSLLVGAAMRVLLSGVFGAYADKREIQAALPAPPPTDLSDRPELWFDFVSDLGDGFAPTYTIASLLAEQKLDLGLPGGPPVETRRGDVLVMGGDQVYPTASTDRYADRLVGPYRAALPWTGADHPRLFAIPGNHDWYDGLTAFMRVFCQQGWIGGRTTDQARSYFALRLPHRWWLWGIDIQFDTYVDAPQLRYFAEVVGPLLQPGDAVVLCTAKPSWVAASKDPEAYANLDYFERKVIRPRGADVRLTLTGDAHHYAHYEQVGGGSHRFTAGGGGAYLSATHRLPAELEVPPAASADPGKTTPPTRYRLAAAYPDRSLSRRLGRGVLRLPLRNPGLAGVLGSFQALCAWAVFGAVHRPGQGAAEVLPGLSPGEVALGLLRSPLSLALCALLAVVLVGFTKAHSRSRGLAVGGPHAAAQLALVVASVCTAARLLSGLGEPWFAFAFAATVIVAGGLAATLLLAVYLLLADAAGCNTNELFSAQAIPDYKNFLRLHLGADGALTVYPVGVDRTCRDWRLRSGGAPDDPWFEPDGEPPRPRLIEPPVRMAAAGERR